MERVRYIDSLRGFAILLVIVGHLIQYNYSSVFESPLFNVIYSFHMPLFFFISGCARALHEDSDYGISKVSNNIINKFSSFIVPSLFWTLVVPFFLSDIFYVHINQVSSYWFLNVLFVIFAFWELFTYVESKFTMKWLLYVLVFILIAVPFICGVKRIPLTYLSYFILGVFFQRYNLLNKIPSVIYCLFFLFFCFFVRKFVYGTDAYGSPERVWLQMPLAICASFCLMRIFSSFGEYNNKLYDVLSYVGKYTLGIYLAHFLFVRLNFIEMLEYNVPIIWQFLILFLFAVPIAFCCIFIQEIIKPFGWLYRLMYGSKISNMFRCR